MWRDGLNGQSNDEILLMVLFQRIDNDHAAEDNLIDILITIISIRFILSVHAWYIGVILSTYS